MAREIFDGSIPTMNIVGQGGLGRAYVDVLTGNNGIRIDYIGSLSTSPFQEPKTFSYHVMIKPYKDEPRVVAEHSVFEGNVEFENSQLNRPSNGEITQVISNGTDVTGKIVLGENLTALEVYIKDAFSKPLVTLPKSSGLVKI